MAGDLVRVVKTDDSLISVGSYGVIEGRIGKRRSSFSVVFNHTTPWWDKGFVTASGGPVRNIKASKMKPTSEMKSYNFHYFEGLPSADSAKTMTKVVNVFEVDLSA